MEIKLLYYICRLLVLICRLLNDEYVGAKLDKIEEQIDSIKVF